VVAQWTRSQALEAGAQRVAFDLPALEQGDYLADFWIEQAGSKLDFASTDLRVKAAGEIEDLKPDKNAFGLAEAVAGVVTAAGPQGARLRVSVCDNYGRLRSEQELRAASGAPTRFTLPPLGASLTVLHRVRARLIDAGGAGLHTKSAEFSVNDLRHEPDLHYIVWTVTTPDAQLRALTDAGFNAHYLLHEQLPQLAAAYAQDARHNMRSLTWLNLEDAFSAKPPDEHKDHMRHFCLSDPATIQTVDRHISERTPLAASEAICVVHK